MEPAARTGRTPRELTSRGAAIAFGLSLTLAACGGGGGGSGSPPASGPGGVVAPGGGAGTGGASATNQPQWQLALQALANGTQTPPLHLEAPALAAYNHLLARAWPHALPRIVPALEQALQGAIGIGAGGVEVLDVYNVRYDLSAPPRLGASGQAPSPRVELALPAPPASWTVAFTAEVGGFVRFNLFGFPQNIQVATAIEVTASGIRVQETVDVDLSDADDPKMVAFGIPAIALTLQVSSPDPIVSTITGLLTQALDPVVRAALIVGAYVARDQIGLAMANVNTGAPWGLGGPQAGPGPAPVRPLAEIADELQREIAQTNMPFDQLLVAVFDTPHQGGSVESYHHHGDSALWTGVLGGTLALRHDLTGDAHALQMLERILRGQELMLHISPTRDGLLSRTAVPLHSPHVAVIQRSGQYFVGEHQGTLYGGIGAVSRDSYTGTFFGFAQTWHRVPSLRPKVLPLIDRAIGYLEANDWIAFREDGSGLSVLFLQAPSQVLGFSRLAALAMPARWGHLAQRHEPLATLLWLTAWASSREVHEGYYGYSLGHLNLTTLVTLETDLGRYRNYVQTLRMMRATVGHHQNAYFDAVAAMVVPPEAPSIRPVIEDTLARWTHRPRRGFTQKNSDDPTIAKVSYTMNLPNHTGSPTAPMQTQPRTREVALYPIPIELRPPAEYLWTSSPFKLDGTVNPREQFPGVDLMLPYWLCRSHGILP